MKPIRLWLLVLLAVLLPLRGALAAALMCPVAGVGVQAEVQLADHAGGHEHGHGGHGHDHAGGEAADKCNLCSAFCSVPGMVSLSTAVAAPGDTATVFPQLRAPPPSFISGGQERPPRST